MKRSITFVLLLIAVLITAVFIASAQPSILTDYEPPPEFATHTAQPTAQPGAVYPPNPTFIPFLPVPTVTYPDYRATLAANGWRLPPNGSP